MYVYLSPGQNIVGLQFLSLVVVTSIVIYDYGTFSRILSLAFDIDHLVHAG